MKRIFLLAALLLTAFSAMAQEPYYNTEPGRVYYYERSKVSNGKLTQTTQLDFDSLKNTPNGKRVYYGILLRKANGHAMLGGRADLHVDINPRGDVYMDMGRALEAVLKNMFPKAKTSSQGTPAIMPAHMNPGDTLPDAHAFVKAGSVKATVDITERRVLRYEKITTPAGTFDCVVIREHKVEKTSLFNHDEWSENWYARGIGYVRHDKLDEDMQAREREILIRIDQKQE